MTAVVPVFAGATVFPEVSPGRDSLLEETGWSLLLETGGFLLLE